MFSTGRPVVTVKEDGLKRLPGMWSALFYSKLTLVTKHERKCDSFRGSGLWGLEFGVRVRVRARVRVRVRAKVPGFKGCKALGLWGFRVIRF